MTFFEDEGFGLQVLFAINFLLGPPKEPPKEPPAYKRAIITTNLLGKEDLEELGHLFGVMGPVWTRSSRILSSEHVQY